MKTSLISQIVLSCTILVQVSYGAAFDMKVFSGQTVIGVKKDEDKAHRISPFLSPSRHMFVLCDGHSFASSTLGGAYTGAHAAQHVVEQLPLFLEKQIASAPNMNIALTSAVADTDASMSHFHGVGTTLAFVMVDEKKLFIGNVGDSRVILSQNGKALQPIDDHGVESPRELARMAAAGHEKIHVRGCLTHNRVNITYREGWQCPQIDDSCKLSLGLQIDIRKGKRVLRASNRFTRSLGDLDVKNAKPGVVVGDLELAEIDLEPTIEFAIIASDGVTETTMDNPITNQEAVDLVATILRDSENLEVGAQQASDELAKLAKTRVGFDDISVIVVAFDHGTLPQG